MLYLPIILHFGEISKKLVLTVVKISAFYFDADPLSNTWIVIKLPLKKSHKRARFCKILFFTISCPLVKVNKAPRSQLHVLSAYHFTFWIPALKDGREAAPMCACDFLIEKSE
jgi:hypothetical protein